MSKRFRSSGLCLAALLLAGLANAWAADADPAACLQEIQKVCVQMEDHLEDCLSQRGDRMTMSCRDELQSAITYMQDPTGPATCVPDIQRLCPDLKSNRLAECVTEKYSQFSAACQKYLQKSGQQENGDAQ